MKKNAIKLFTTLLIISTMFTACSKSKIITDDFDNAKKLAANSNKDILVIITSDGDDLTSSDFISKVLNNSSFNSVVKNNFVVAHLDFSSSTYKKTVAAEDASEKEKQQANIFSERVYRNSIFANSLNVESTPAAYLVTKDPYVISIVNFDAANPDYNDFISALTAASNQVGFFHEQLNKIDNGSISEKIEAIDEIINITEVVHLPLLADKVETLIQMDTHNESGLLSKYLVLHAKIKATDAMSSRNYETAAGIFDNLAQNKELSPEEKQDAYYNAAYVLTFASNPDFNRIIAFLTSAIEVNPEGTSTQGLIEIRDSLLVSMEQAAQNSNN